MPKSERKFSLIQQFFSLVLYSSDLSGTGGIHLREKKIHFPLFHTHIKDFETYQQGRVWQYSLVPVIDQMLYQAEHGWWSSGDSSLALLVHVLSLAPSLLPSILLGQHQDQVLVHFPEREFMKHSGHLKLRHIGCLPFVRINRLGRALNNGKGFSKISKTNRTKWRLPFALRFPVIVFG